MTPVDMLYDYQLDDLLNKNSSTLITSSRLQKITTLYSLGIHRVDYDAIPLYKDASTQTSIQKERRYINARKLNRTNTNTNTNTNINTNTNQYSKKMKNAFLTDAKFSCVEVKRNVEINNQLFISNKRIGYRRGPDITLNKLIKSTAYSPHIVSIYPHIYNSIFINIEPLDDDDDDPMYIDFDIENSTEFFYSTDVYIYKHANYSLFIKNEYDNYLLVSDSKYHFQVLSYLNNNYIQTQVTEGNKGNKGKMKTFENLSGQTIDLLTGNHIEYSKETHLTDNEQIAMITTINDGQSQLPFDINLNSRGFYKLFQNFNEVITYSILDFASTSSSKLFYKQFEIIDDSIVLNTHNPGDDIYSSTLTKIDRNNFELVSVIRQYKTLRIEAAKYSFHEIELNTSDLGNNDLYLEFDTSLPYDTNFINSINTEVFEPEGIIIIKIISDETSFNLLTFDSESNTNYQIIGSKNINVDYCYYVPDEGEPFYYGYTLSNESESGTRYIYVKYKFSSILIENGKKMVTLNVFSN
tara:strand:- start:778 stop:2349 length:1572 start_codon:yes stop_codon:yes gene_type:complete